MTRRALHPRSRETRVLLALPLRMRFGRDIARGIAERAEVFGWTLRATDDTEPDILRYLSEHAADYTGVIGAFSNPSLMQFLRSNLPSVNVSNRAKLDLLPRVISDDVEVGRLAARHFLAKGYTSFAFIGIHGHRYSDERREGFLTELSRHGRECRVYTGEGVSPEDAPVFRDRFVRALPKPVALFAANDIMACHVAQAARAAGISVPDQAAILGVDDDETEGLLAGIPLSSVRIPFAAIGARAAALLAELLAGAPPPGAPIRLPPVGVIERRSTDVAAVDDPILSKALRYAREAPAVAATLRAAAAHAGISVRGLQYRCKARLGRRFHDVVLDLRLQRARQLLIESNLNVSEIAQACGLGAVAQFSRAFRKRFGAAPTQFRRQAREG